MTLKYSISLLLISLATASGALAEIRVTEVPYKHGEVSLVGTLVYDAAQQSPAPGVLLVHEWWGKNDYAVRRAKEIASLGYTVFAVDMYGEATTVSTPAEAKKLSSPFYESRELMRSRALAGLKVLEGSEYVNKNSIALLGYCFGGTVALELARTGAPVKAVVVFHGGLATPDESSNKSIKGKVLVLNGEDDPFVSTEERNSFKSSLIHYGIPLTFINYPGAVHAFTNRAVDAIKLEGARYNKTADAASWKEMQTFLKANL